MTPAEIITGVAALQNDAAQTLYTNSACLPYLNLAMDELKEIMELNDIPLVEESTDIITLIAGQDRLGYATVPALPLGLVEAKRLWESFSGQNIFIPMSRREYLPHNLEGIEYPYFRVWVWHGDEIRFLPSVNNLDVKLDYIRDVVPTPIVIEDIDKQFVSIGLRKFKLSLEYLTAALCSMFIGENETRALALAQKGESAVQRALGITIKPKQSIVTRRRPYRSAYKLRNTYA